MHLLIKKYSLLLVMAMMVNVILQAQPCSLPGMTPATAIPVCGTQVFTQTTVVTCTGTNLASNVCNNVPVTTDNSFWYKFTCFSSGTLGFTITPTGPNTDFDWELLDVTNRNLSDIYTDPTMRVSINLSGVIGATGCSTAGTTDVNCEGNTPRFNRLANIIQGREYLLQIANWSNSGTGYTLEFGGGTAVIADPTTSLIANAESGCGNQQAITVRLTKDIKCSSLTGTGSEFILNPGGYLPVSVTSSCQQGTFGATLLTLQYATNIPPGNYTLEVRNGTDGNTILDACDNATPVGASFNLTVPARPVASFSVTAPFCEGQSISFTDASTTTTGTIVDRTFNPGDGTPPINPTTSPFTYTYATPGNYTATLTVTNSAGCTSPVFSLPVVVSPRPQPAFTSSPACLPNGLVNFTNTSTISNGAPMTYQWFFGDPASGSNDSSNLINPSHFYNAPGPYSIKLKAVSNGCERETITVINTIFEQAKADFTVNAENCLQTATVFNSTSNPLAGNTITDWFWDFGNGNTATGANPAYTYPAAGTFTVRHWIRTDKGCNSDTMTKTVTINPLPTASFTSSTPLCATEGISFSDGSTANAGTLTAWNWSFGDATGATTQNPTHIYTTPGTYTVSLNSISSKGCVSPPFTRQITVSPLPRPGFIVPEVCLTDTYAQFTDTSRIATGSISSWLWNFGNPASGANNTSTQQNPQHSYTAIGNYIVTLTVTGNSGCTATLTSPITVNGDIPVANFNAVNPAAFCANDSIAIQDASTVNFGNITKVEIYWDNIGSPTVFETDEQPAPGKIYKHKYPDFQSPLVRNFTIRYRAYSGGICVNDRIRIIAVNASPRVAFAPIPNTCLDAAPFPITQASETGGVPGTGVFSGPGVSANGIFSPSVTGAGTYRIRYTYTATAGGCTDTISQTITVLEPAVANFTVSSPLCATRTVTFFDNSTLPPAAGTITNWRWNFGDGAPLLIATTNAPVTHTYAFSGNFTVRLSVVTSNGCTSVEKTLPITINPLPRPNFSFPASVCLPNASITFTNTSSIADGTENSFTYQWNFGDPASGNNSSSAQNPTHLYSGVGPFDVRLLVTSGAGCTHDTTITLDVIHPQPKADFDLSRASVCVGDGLTLTDQSDGLDGSVTGWFWNLGNNTTRNTPVVNYTYPTPGNYTISLYITNSRGCRSDTAEQPFTVHPYPEVNAGPDRVVLEGESITLTPVVSGNDLEFLWTPNQYFLSGNAIRTPLVKGVEDITYTLEVSGRGGCTRSDDVFVKVLRTPLIPNTFTPNNDGVNDFWAIRYLNDYPDARVQVFTRTGQLVFESRRYTRPWDGTLQGKALPFDTYYYVIEPGSGRKPLTGYVTIIK
jgi:gliding motility-associated-like protein